MKKILKSRVFSNFLSLLFLQGFNYILPLITLPYLVQTLGPANYGIVAFAQSFTMILIIITDYGFNLSATKDISINRQNKHKISEIFNSVLLIKLFLLFLAFCVLVISTTYVPKLHQNSSVFYMTFLMLVGQVLLPLWFYQGMERMKFITVFNVIAKTIFAFGIFVFVKGPEDILLVPLINGIGFILVGLVALSLAIIKFNIRLIIPSRGDIIYQLKEGWYIFISTIAMSLYTVSNTFILGLLTNNTIVGYYSSAEKLLTAANGLISPLSQALFPHMNRIAVESIEKASVLLKKILKGVAIITFIMSVAVFVLAEFIVQFLFGPGYEQSVTVLQISAVLPFLIGVSNILGIQTMIPFGYKREFSMILIIASVSNVILSLILVPLLQHNGTALSVVITESFVTVSMYIFLYKKKFKPLEEKMNV